VRVSALAILAAVELLSAAVLAVMCWRAPLGREIEGVGFVLGEG
jgi:hypothetical protein